MPNFYQPNDVLLAFKHIALSDKLNGTEKQFAAFLIDSHNKRTGRCDPSEETASHILRISKRTIIRAGNRLVALKLFKKLRHGGHNHCNFYQPNWELFRDLEIEYKGRRRQWTKRFERPKLSSSERHSCHSCDDNAVTQTFPINHSQSTYPIAAGVSANAVRRETKKEEALCNEVRVTHSAPLSPPGPSLTRQAAEIAAERRWNKELQDHFLSTPYYAIVVDALDARLQAAATDAEMVRRGAGLACILSELARRGIEWA